MKNIKLSVFVKEFFTTNLFLIVCYYVCLLFLNLFLEGDLAQLSGALELFGYYAKDLSRQQITVIIISTIVVNVIIFAGYYIISFIRLKKNDMEKREFLSYIGSSKYDEPSFEKYYFSNKGKRTFIYYASIICLVAFLGFVGVPFFSMIILPQSNLFSSVLTCINISGLTRKAILFLLTVSINILLYFFYQKKVCVKIYSRWASERLRID